MLETITKRKKYTQLKEIFFLLALHAPDFCFSSYKGLLLLLLYFLNQKSCIYNRYLRRCLIAYRYEEKANLCL